MAKIYQEINNSNSISQIIHHEHYMPFWNDIIHNIKVKKVSEDINHINLKLEFGYDFSKRDEKIDFTV